MIEYYTIGVLTGIILVNQVMYSRNIKQLQGENRKLIDRLIAKSLNEVRQLEINTSDQPKQEVDQWEDLIPISEADPKTFDDMIKKTISKEEPTMIDELKAKAKQKLGK
jgi:hypothetical protein